MNVEIRNLTLTGAKPIMATFDAEVDGWGINGCVIAEGRNDGRPMALPPFSEFGNRRRCVTMPDRIWKEFAGAAVDTFRIARRDRKVISAENETLRIAGM